MHNSSMLNSSMRNSTNGTMPGTGHQATWREGRLYGRGLHGQWIGETQTLTNHLGGWCCSRTCSRKTSSLAYVWLDSMVVRD
jgi:hypothetical protein